MISRKFTRSLTWLAWGAALLVVPSGALGASARTSHAGNPGIDESCAATYRAVAHGPSARPVVPAPVRAPFACGIETGVVSTSPTIAVAPDGTAFVGLSSGGVLRSEDAGRTWTHIDPGTDRSGDSHDGGLHGDVWVDHNTGRVFYVTFGDVKACGGTGLHLGAVPTSGGEYVSFSDDDGNHWHHSVVGCDMWDWPKIFTGPAVYSHTHGYRDIVYVAASYPLPLGPLKKVYKSLNGGVTWQPTGEVASDSFEPGQGVTGPDGSIYMDEVYTRGADAQLLGSPYPYQPMQQGQMRVVISRDEGRTWTHVAIPEAHAALTMYGAQRVAVDSAGNVYAVWTDEIDHKPHLAVSRDGGRTWSHSITIQPPEVQDANFLVQVAAGRPGQIVVSYLGSPDRRLWPSGAYLPDLRTYEGYITRSNDALNPNPIFWTARVNSLADPLAPALRLSDAAGETLGAALGPDGSAWGTYVRTTSPLVPGPAVTYPHPPQEVVVGRLLPTPVPRHRQERRRHLKRRHLKHANARILR